MTRHQSIIYMLKYNHSEADRQVFSGVFLKFHFVSAGCLTCFVLNVSLHEQRFGTAVWIVLRKGSGEYGSFIGTEKYHENVRLACGS